VVLFFAVEHLWRAKKLFFLAGWFFLIDNFGSPNLTLITFPVLGFLTYTADFLLWFGVLNGLFNVTVLFLYFAITILLYEHSVLLRLVSHNLSYLLRLASYQPYVFCWRSSKDLSLLLCHLLYDDILFALVFFLLLIGLCFFWLRCFFLFAHTWHHSLFDYFHFLILCCCGTDWRWRNSN